MAAYDYRCRTCDSVFEVHRPITAEAAAMRCPDGHSEVSRVWSAVALATGGAAQPQRAAPAAGGCCGGGCCAGSA
jgi:putative FmdB family regulatory protein